MAKNSKLYSTIGRGKHTPTICIMVFQHPNQALYSWGMSPKTDYVIKGFPRSPELLFLQRYKSSLGTEWLDGSWNTEFSSWSMVKPCHGQSKQIFWNLPFEARKKSAHPFQKKRIRRICKQIFKQLSSCCHLLRWKADSGRLWAAIKHQREISSSFLRHGGW